LSPDTTYFYEVESADPSGNTATDNNSGSYYQFTTAAAPSNDMHVDNIDMSFELKGKSGKGKIITTATILDAGGSPVSNAQVTLNLSGTDGTNVTKTASTDSGGNVTFTYNKAKTNNTYTATVTDVTKGGWTYDFGSNVVSSDSITI